MSKSQIHRYLSLPYSRVLTAEEDGRFSAYVLEWPGCYGDGDTADEANASLEASMATWVSVMLEDGRPIPEPLAAEYNGRILCRMPKETHRRLAARAAAEGVSINSLILTYVERGLSSETSDRSRAPSAWHWWGKPSSRRATDDVSALLLSGLSDCLQADTSSSLKGLIFDEQGHWGIARDVTGDTPRESLASRSRRRRHD